MKTPKESKPVFLTPRPRAPHKRIAYADDPEAFKNALAKVAGQFDTEQYLDRIRYNLGLVMKNAEAVLRAKGIDSPRFIELRTDGGTDWTTGKAARLICDYKAQGSCVVFDWQVDEQARLAAQAYGDAAEALKSLEAGRLLNCIDRSLLAAVRGMEAVVVPYIEKRAKLRKRIVDTERRGKAVSNAWMRFREKFKRSPRPAIAHDFAWLNDDLRRSGAKPFDTLGAFTKWKSQHRVHLE